MGTLIKLIIAIGAIVVAFKINVILGIFAIIFVIYYLYTSNYSEYLAMRANALYNNGDTEQALLYYKKAVSRKTHKFDTVLGYAMLLLRTGNPNDALEQVNYVLSFSNLVRDIKLRAKQIRSLINYKLGDVDEALLEATELFEDGYTTSDMHCIVGLYMIEAKKPWDEVLAFCEKAYDYDADNRDILDNYLVALIKTGNLEKAKEILAELLRLAPKFVEAHYHGAMLYNKLGDNKKAKELLEKIPDCKRTYMTTVSEEEIKELKERI